MVKGIALQAIAGRAGIGRRPIAARFGQADQGSVFQFTPGSYTFTPPKAGYWKVVAWGPGGQGDNTSVAGGSGGYCEKTAFLSPTQSIALVVSSGGSGTSTTVTLPATVVSAGTGGLGAGGATSGGDVNLNGSAGGAGAGSGGGVANGSAPGAPANLPFRGGAGFATPGGGGGIPSASPKGDGMVIIFFVRP